MSPTVTINAIQRWQLQGLLWLVLVLLAPPSVGAVDIADFPIEGHVNEAPANLVFVLDDSGSMDSEFMLPQPNGRPAQAYYLFPDESYLPEVDHTFGPGNALDPAQRFHWRTQWVHYNSIYFDPAKCYSPWPATDSQVFEDADLHFPWSNPVQQASDPARCQMAVTFFAVVDASGKRVLVPNAHYFTTHTRDGDSGPNYYLVTWQDQDQDGELDLGTSLSNDQRCYYRFQDDGDDRVEDGELVPVTDLSVINYLRPGACDDQGYYPGPQTDAQELQNFVNWFSYHRRRGYVLKHAVAGAISRMTGIQVGFYALNAGPRIPVQPVKVVDREVAALSSDVDILDRTDYLLDRLYAMDSAGSTPLRTALDQVGRYFDQTRTSTLGESPFWAEIKGGGCQRAYAVVITDGYWNDAFSGLGNVDAGQGSPYADGWADTLADIALYYFMTDLSVALPDGLPAKGCDQATHQHLATHAVTLGVAGTLDPRDIDGDGLADYPGYFQDPCFEDPRTPRPVWPRPVADQPSVIDDVWHAAINGRGIYVNADAPGLLTDALMGIVSDVQDGQTTAASVAIAGPVLQRDAIVYQTRYRTDQWTGDLVALPYSPGSGEWRRDPDALLWSAAEQLRQPGITADSRRIVTYGGVWRTPRGVPFRYDELSASQKRALGSDLTGGSARDASARALVDYLRGQETAPFRPRESVLGDMVHSTPVLAGQTVFVGANDGMLHAFNARTGEERFAYVPRLVFENLKNLAEPGYLAGHRFFVDAGPSIGEVMVDEYQRHTYLVGGLGKGGMGYYCLLINESRRNRSGARFGPYEDRYDVDDLDAGASEYDIAARVQWEYPRPDTGDDGMDNDVDGFVDEADELDPDMGYSFGQGYAVNANADPEAYRSVVIFGNGYGSRRGHAVLFILDAEKGTLVRKIDTGVGEDNGLSLPAVVDVDLDRRVDYAYAGDLKGNLWKFDLRSADAFQWGIAYGDDLDRNARIDAADGDEPQPVFQAVDQPITARPDVMAARSICAADAPGYIVIFGTGKYLGLSDHGDIRQQSIYALWDYGDDGDDSEFLGHIIDRASGRLSQGLGLVRQKLVAQTLADGTLVRELSNKAIDFSVMEDPGDGDGLRSNNHRAASADPVTAAGWFFDFPVPPEANAEPGERVLGNVIIRGGQAQVTSFAPDPAPCARGGVSWVYLLSGCTADEVPADATASALYRPMTAKRFDRWLAPNPVIIKDPNHMAEDQLILSDDRGAIYQQPFLGEKWGKVYWRQNSE